MIFRTESFSVGALGAPAAIIVKAIAKAMAVIRAGLFGRPGQHTSHVLTLSGHELRDIGIEHEFPGAPIAYDLLDLLPRGSYLNHRIPR